MDIADRLAGAVWGHLVGDACGVPYEFRSAGTILDVHFGVAGTHGQPPGTWSDDGALMLALLDSLLRERTAGEPLFDTGDQAARALAWADQGAYTPNADGRFDIGTATAPRSPASGAGARPSRRAAPANGTRANGSLMRILPVALVDRDIADGELIERAHRASAVTHGHLVAQVTCALYLLVARELLQHTARSEALTTAQASLRAHYAAHDPARLSVLDVIEGWSGRSGRGYVVDSFWSAWDAFAGAKDYRDSVERAIHYGQDTDTTAAIAGGLAGIGSGGRVSPHNGSRGCGARISWSRSWRA